MAAIIIQVLLQVARLKVIKVPSSQSREFRDVVRLVVEACV